jgi:hypothetical protein
MREVIMLPVQELQKYKEIEKRYNALLAKKDDTDQIGSGAKEVQQVLEIEEKNQLESPYLKVDSLHPSSSSQAQTSSKTIVDPLSCVPDRYKKKARILLKKLSTKPELSWDINGTIKIDGKEVNGAKVQDLFPMIFYGIRKSNVPGENQFFQKLKDLKLGHLIRSVHKSDKKWYFIGNE